MTITDGDEPAVRVVLGAAVVPPLLRPLLDAPAGERRAVGVDDAALDAT